MNTSIPKFAIGDIVLEKSQPNNKVPAKIIDIETGDYPKACGDTVVYQVKFSDGLIQKTSWLGEFRLISAENFAITSEGK